MHRTLPSVPGPEAGVLLADRRAHRRLPLSVFIEIHTASDPGRIVEKAVTSDVSSGGLRFSSFNWRQLPVGARFRVVLSLPFESVIFTDRRLMAAAATVVRVMDEDVAGFGDGPAPGPKGGGAPQRAARIRSLRRSVALKFDESLTFASSM